MDEKEISMAGVYQIFKNLHKKINSKQNGNGYEKLSMREVVEWIKGLVDKELLKI